MVTCIAGALLAVDLTATATDLAAGEGALRALALIGQNGADDQMHSGGVDGSSKELLAQLHFANGRAFHVIQRSLRHGVDFLLHKRVLTFPNVWRR